MDEIEVEVKIWLSDSVDPLDHEMAATEMADLLENSGWSHGSTEIHRDLYLQHPSRDLKETDEALRIRIVKDQDDGRTRTFITYKGPKLSNRSKARFEKEVKVPGIEDIREIFYRLGFSKVMVVEKERRTYHLNDMEACIDLVPDLGCFLELEVMDDDITHGEERVTHFMDEWDLSGNERRSYLEMLIEK